MFKSYPSIETIGKKFKPTKNLEECWILTEKIHGANLSFIVTEDSIKCCKRTAILEEGEVFYNYKEVQEKYTPDLMKLRELLNSDYQIYGELFGGLYGNRKKSPVQNGISYLYEKDFLAFDIYLLKPVGIYLSYDKMTAYMDQLNLLKYVPEMKRGSFDELIGTDPNFESEVYKLYGLEKLEGNIAEGFVLKVNETASRLNCIKVKSKKFLETKPHVKVEKKEVTEFYNEIINYLTQERYDNVLSKYGQDENPEKLKAIFMNDAIADFKENTDELDEKLFKTISSDLNKRIKKSLSIVEHRVNFK